MRRLDRWPAPLVGLLLASASILLWLLLSTREDALIRTQIAQDTRALSAELTGRLEALFETVERNARRWERRGGTPETEWRADASLYLEHDSTCQALAWIDAALRPRWIVIAKDVKELDQAFEDGGFRTWLQTQSLQEVRWLARSFDLPEGGRGLWLGVPIPLAEEPAGFIVGVLDVSSLVDQTLETRRSQGPAHPYALALYENGRRIVISPGGAPSSSKVFSETTLPLSYLEWRLRLQPTSELLERLESPLPEVVLAGGLSMALLLALAVHLGQTRHARSLQVRQAQRNLGDEAAARHLAESRLQDLSESFEDRVDARTEELQRSRDDAVDRMQEARRAQRRAKHAERKLQALNDELETLLYVASHDLREPLRAIEQFSQIVQHDYGSHLDEEGQDLLHRMVRASARMQGLLDDLLALSRARRVRPPKEEIPGAELVREALAQLEEAIRKSGAHVKVARSFPTLRADRTWGSQALCNLVANALKFTREGQTPQIEIRSYRARHNGRIESGFLVRDRGPGVEPQHAEQIFGLFKRAVGREVEGSGSGLAIVRAVAERHGGRAWVQSRRGGGAEFVITFGPAATDKQGEPI